jgi:hypothetical protein
MKVASHLVGFGWLHREEQWVRGSGMGYPTLVLFLRHNRKDPAYEGHAQ